MNHKTNESLQHCAVHFRQSFYEFCFDAPRIGELTLFSWSKKMNISSPILKSIFSSSVKVWTVTCNCGTQSFKNQNRSNFLCEVWCYVMNEDVCTGVVTTTLSHQSGKFKFNDQWFAKTFTHLGKSSKKKVLNFGHCRNLRSPPCSDNVIFSFFLSSG